MCPKISLKWDNFSSYLFPPTLSTDIAMQRCILGNIFDNHLKELNTFTGTNNNCQLCTYHKKASNSQTSWMLFYD